ncbi:MAG: hypothetical protein AB1668_06355 [Nanoarchaeota archaeon]
MTLNILLVEESLIGEPLADMLRGQGHNVDLHETDEDVDRLRGDAERLKRYGLLIIEPFGKGRAGYYIKSSRIQLIRSFGGRKYITTEVHSGLVIGMHALYGLEKGKDYDRLYPGPYNTIRLARDIAADFGFPERNIDLDKPYEPRPQLR